jgi:phage I-like protein
MPAKQRQLQIAALAGTMVDLHALLGPGPAPLAPRIPPTEFRIFRKGINKSDKGEFLFDEQAAASVMETYAKKGVDIMIDYDHAVLKAPTVKAVAAGWCSFEVRDGELWATKVSWTPTALDHFAKSEYRYFSPLFDFDMRTGRILHVINSALTNTPALHGIDALVAASATTTPGEESTMDEELKKALARNAELERQAAAQSKELETLRGQTATVALSSSLGLGMSATADDIRTRVAALVSFQKSVLGIAGKDSEAAAIGALTAMREQAAEAGELRTKAEAAETARLSAEFKSYLDGLSTTGTDGKFLPPAKRLKAEQMALSFGGGKLTAKGIEAAKEYIAEMLVAGEAPGNTNAPANTVALSAQEIEIAKNTGSSIEKLKAYKKEKLAGGNAG